jgi:hypothetical protein
LEESDLMPVDPELLSMFPHIVTILKKLDVNEYNEDVFDIDNPVYQGRALIQHQNRIVPETDSQNRRSSYTQVYLPEVVGVTVEHRVILPDGSYPVVLVSDSMNDETGEGHHEIVYLS